MNTMPVQFENWVMSPRGTEGIMLEQFMYQKKPKAKIKNRGGIVTGKQIGRAHV